MRLRAGAPFQPTTLSQVFGSVPPVGPAKILAERDRGVRAAAGRRYWRVVTVLLEAAWVLESVYELSAAEAARALRGLLGLPKVQVEDAGAVAAALEATGRGLGLADALHLLRAPHGVEFATFDRGFARSGRRLRPVRLV